MSDFYPTKHLMEKLQSRNVTWAEVVEVLENPEVKYGPDYRGRKTLQKGDLCVIVGRDGGVVTVLLRDADQWDDNDVIERNKKVIEEELKKSILKTDKDTLLFTVIDPQKGLRPPVYGCTSCCETVRGDYAETHAKEHGFEFWTLASSARETRPNESKP